MSKKAKCLALPEVDRIDDPILGAILTLQEASLIFGKSRSTIIYHVHCGNVRGTRAVTGGNYIIRLDDLLKLYRVKDEWSWLIKNQKSN